MRKAVIAAAVILILPVFFVSGCKKAAPAVPLFTTPVVNMTFTVTATETIIETKTITATVTSTVTETVTATLTSTVTATVTMTPTCTYLFGTNGDYNNSQWSAGYFLAYPVVVASALTVNMITIKLTSPGNYIVALYNTQPAGSITVPKDVIAQSSIVYGTTGWNQAGITSTVLAPGNYFLVMKSDTAGIAANSTVGTHVVAHIAGGLYGPTEWSAIQASGMPSGLTSAAPPWNFFGGTDVMIYASNCPY